MCAVHNQLLYWLQVAVMYCTSNQLKLLGSSCSRSLCAESINDSPRLCVLRQLHSQGSILTFKVGNLLLRHVANNSSLVGLDSSENFTLVRGHLSFDVAELLLIGELIGRSLFSDTGSQILHTQLSVAAAIRDLMTQHILTTLNLILHPFQIQVSFTATSRQCITTITYSIGYSIRAVTQTVAETAKLSALFNTHAVQLFKDELVGIVQTIGSCVTSKHTVTKSAKCKENNKNPSHPLLTTHHTTIGSHHFSKLIPITTLSKSEQICKRTLFHKDNLLAFVKLLRWAD
nr:MAG TPA: hypothetical protein [Caudoviricetes sp.]